MEGVFGERDGLKERMGCLGGWGGGGGGGNGRKAEKDGKCRYKNKYLLIYLLCLLLALSTYSSTQADVVQSCMIAMVSQLFTRCWLGGNAQACE